MATEDTESYHQTPPQAVVKRSRLPSLVWLMPIAAALIAGWLVLDAYFSAGPQIDISFASGEGLEADKTAIRYRDVDVGRIEDLHFSEDLSRIVVSAKLEPEMAPYLREGTRFWVVRPRLSAAGVSGLNTLVSGAYIAMDPGEGEIMYSFTGVESPPVVRSGINGKEFLLRAARVGSNGPGSPVYYRGLAVGEVIAADLASDRRSTEIRIFIRAPYAELVRDRTRFWNVSGIHAEIDADGVQLDIESLHTLLAGGVNFETPDAALDAPPSAEGTAFSLHDGQESQQPLLSSQDAYYLVYFDGSVRGLSIGNPVEFRGIRIGRVADIRLQVAPEQQDVRVPVTLAIDAAQLGLDGDREAANSRLAAMIDKGLRAQLQSGNLLTGQLIVALNYFPDAPTAQLQAGEDYPQIPSLPASLDQAQRSLVAVLNKLADLPLQETIVELQATVSAIRDLVEDDDVQGATASINNALARLEEVMAALERDVPPMTGSLRTAAEDLGQAIKSARSTLQAVDGAIGENSATRHNLDTALKEFAAAARSIRVFADYLERNPEALLRGK